jgi:hypothetical protein
MRRRNPPPQRSKHQHWVPQFYLRYFATPESRDSKTPQVWIFSKNPEDGNEELTSVRNECGKRYLYSPKQLDGTRNWALDDKLNDVEALLGQVWPALATDFVDLSDEHIRKALSLFVSIMHMRHPDMRDALEYLHGNLVEFYETGPLHPDGTPTIESIEYKGMSYGFETTDWHAYKNQGKDGHDRAFVEAVLSETGRMAEHLLKKRWSVLISNREVFVTSDKPVVLQHLSRDRYGYGTKGTIVTFPLSSSRLLVMDDLDNEAPNQYYPLLEETTGAVNMTTWRGARRFLITGRPVLEVLLEFDTISHASNDA